jgi:hypothetical protein
MYRKSESEILPNLIGQTKDHTMKSMIIAGAMVAVLGIAGVAHAAPGNGNGQGNGNSANAESSPGNSGGNGVGNGHGKGLIEAGTKGNSAAALAKDDPLHPRNVGKFNGFLHASPQALANASATSFIGILANEYAVELGAYLGGDLTRAEAMAAILEQIANKPLTPELITAINDKIAEAQLVDPIAYGMSDKTILVDQISTAANLD